MLGRHGPLVLTHIHVRISQDRVPSPSSQNHMNPVLSTPKKDAYFSETPTSNVLGSRPCCASSPITPFTTKWYLSRLPCPRHDYVVVSHTRFTMQAPVFVLLQTQSSNPPGRFPEHDPMWPWHEPIESSRDSSNV